MSRARLCLCPCHEVLAWDDGETVDRHPNGVDVTDEYHAFTACAECQGRHTVALSGRPPELPPRSQPAKEPPSSYEPPTQWTGDATGDGGTQGPGEDGG